MEQNRIHRLLPLGGLGLALGVDVFESCDDDPGVGSQRVEPIQDEAAEPGVGIEKSCSPAPGTMPGIPRQASLTMSLRSPLLSAGPAFALSSSSASACSTGPPRAPG